METFDLSTFCRISHLDYKKDKPSEYVNENSTLQLVSLFLHADTRKKSWWKGDKTFFLRTMQTAMLLQFKRERTQSGSNTQGRIPGTLKL